MNAVILAGGKSSRLAQDKCSLRLGGKPALHRLYDELQGLFERFYLSCGRAVPDAPPALIPLADREPGRGPLGGIHAGLSASQTEHNFFCACDMPFIHRKIVERLMSYCRGRDVVVPRVRGELEPLLAIYGRACLPHVEEQLARGDNRIVSFFPRVNVTVVPEEALRDIDPELLSFFNINTAGDLERAAEILERLGKARQMTDGERRSAR